MAQKTITIAIITCLRPTSLTRAVGSVLGQEVPSEGAYTIKILIVDNDDSGENKKVFEALKKRGGDFEILYAHEPERGIPFARNKAVQTAQDDDALIFMDDDEVAPSGWLEALLRVWESSGADIVTGPVKAVLPEGAPDWAVKSDTFSDLREHETGDVVHKAYTNNVLISRPVLQALAPWFDTFFRYSGSEDIHFFQRAVRQGFKIVWCGDSAMHEIVPKSRVRIGWVIKRSFRNGSGDALADLRIDKSAKTFLKVFVKGGGRCFFGVLMCLKGAALLNWKDGIRGLRIFVSGIGTFAGMFGITYQEYRHIHGQG